MEKAAADPQPTHTHEETCKHFLLQSLDVYPDVKVSEENLHKWLHKYSETALGDPLIMAYLYTIFGMKEKATEKIDEFKVQESQMLQELEGAKDVDEVREEERALQEIVNDSLSHVAAEVAVLAISD